jgi:O-antigen ligase
VLTFLLLVATRSRTAVAVLLLILATPWLLRTARRHVFLAITICMGVAVGGVIVSSMDLVDAANSTIFAREEKDVSLGGRDLIWKELLPYIAERPFVGHGYGFWSVDREFSEPAQSAHSLYVDSVVHFGIIGTLLYFWGIALAMRRAVVSTEKWPAADFGFIALILLYLLVRGITESEIGFTHTSSILAICSIAFLMFREGFDACAAPEPSPRHRLDPFPSPYRLVNGSLSSGDI